MHLGLCIYAALALFRPTVAAPDRSLKRCATDITPDELSAANAHFRANKVVSSYGGRNATRTIDVHFHVISGDSVRGLVLDDQITAQIDVVNTAYKDTGFAFNLKNVTRTTNWDWWANVNQNNAQNYEMKSALRAGDANTLNVYTVGFPYTLYLGFGSWPWKHSTNLIDDGIVVQSGTLPGGSTEYYNLGHTLTHEIGHWLGVYHTFQGGCEGEGDMVDDTPPQRMSTFACPDVQDTCKHLPGDDPIHNYMDYSDDICMTEFTPGQIQRMHEQMDTYRPIL